MPLSKRNELVSELTCFYEFLVNLYLPTDALKRSPPVGWPSVNQEQLAYLNKNDDVIDVLKHVPYIRRDRSLNPYQIYDSCAVNDFTGAYFERFEPFEEEVAAHVVNLAKPAESDGCYIFYDTKNHFLELVDYIDGERRGCGVQDYFETLKNEFREMSVLPVEPRKVYAVKRCDSEVMTMFQGILRRNGWSNADYEKDKCLAELKASRPKTY